MVECILLTIGGQYSRRMHADWIEHRRADDRERLGWIRPDGDAWAAVDALGRDVVTGVDWLTAEEALDARGLRFLAEPWGLRMPDGRVQRVRITRLADDVMEHRR